jgi:arylsulfatase A-like enzyme
MACLGYETPNTDRIAKKGSAFTDCNGQQSCPARSAAFIGRNVTIYSGMTKAGVPGAKEGG